jgi:hypothetical protein
MTNVHKFDFNAQDCGDGLSRGGKLPLPQLEIALLEANAKAQHKRNKRLYEQQQQDEMRR